MAKILPYGAVTFPSQGSNEITERVKHFESTVDFDDLQLKINLYIVILSSQVIANRPAIRSITFQIFEKQQNPNKGQFQYFAQLHYMLIGDADDSPGL